MRKSIFIILFAALLLFACQPTPEEPIVLQKDQDLMIQQGSATLPPDQSYTPPEVPERYQFNFQDGALTIRADAEVVVPSVPMPIVNVCARGIPQETMYRLFRLLSNGEELVMQRRTTKAEIAAMIQQWEEQMDAGPEAWDDMTQEEYQTGLRRKIEKAKESYKTAPETEERRIADGTYDDTYVQWSKTDCKTVVAQNQNRWFTVYSYENGNWDSQFQYTRFPFFSVMNMAHYDETVDLPEGLRYADAKAEAETVLAAIGEPFAIAAVYRVGDATDNSGNDSLKSGTHYALRFDCVRTVKGVPLAMDTSDFGSTDGSSYSIPWKQESLRIIVDADGIVSTDWGGPLAVQDPVAEAATLMPFDKIRGIVEKMLPIIYNPTGWVETEAMEINVCSARLELIRIREQNNTKELQGMLVPAWVFYGTIEAKVEYASETMYEEYGMGGGTPFYNGDTIILCINAIDGSIIDPMLGY